MDTQQVRKCGFRLHRGGRYARFRSAKVQITGPELWQLDADMQAAFASLEDATGHVPSRGVQAIREKHHRPWRVLGRRLRELRNAGVPEAQSLALIATLAEWVHGLYRKGGERPLAA